MKGIRILYFSIFLLSNLVAFGQVRPMQNPYSNSSVEQMDPNMIPNDPDSLNRQVEVVSLPPRITMWRISEELGEILPTEVDTVHHQFQNTNLTEGMNGHYNYLGNMNAPRMSRVFFDRKEPGQLFFLAPFDFYIKQPQEMYFTNSNIPYTNITYYKTFNKLYGEERLKAYFSVNVNKHLAFGFNFDYLYGRGYYQYQSTSSMKTGLFGSYNNDKYQAHFVANNFHLKMRENGGLTDDRYITNPEEMAGDGRRETETFNIPTVFQGSTWNRNNYYYVYLTHRYNLGFYREMPNPRKEEVIKENEGKIPAQQTSLDNIPDTIDVFIPVSSIIHTAKIERSSHRFLSREDSNWGYMNTFINPAANLSNDSTTYIGVKNTVGLSLKEGFNKYAKAGLTAFVSHKYNRYNLMSLDTIGNRYTEHELYLGGELSKRQGNFLHYYATGEVGMAGEAIGQFRVSGNIDLNFRLGKDTVNFIARGAISNTLPSFYMRHYHSNHYWWDNDNMDKEFRTRVEGELNIDRWGTNLSAGVENIKNYTYLDYAVSPAQQGDNIQVLTARLKQNFKLGIFHLDNEVVWQKSSDKKVLPLPQLSLYSNFYISGQIAKKVLSVELGADVRYFTKYLAPAYSPALQQFHLQTNNVDERVEIGNYPIVNVYANFHLKRTRFFVMMYHVNSGMGNRNAFLVPHHPINQSMLKFGLSWNFFD